MSFLASILNKLYPERRGTFACPCGSVQLELRVPASSYCVVEQTNAICHCHDCIDFCRACPEGNVVINNNSTHMIQFYKSDVRFIRGQDAISSVKLTEKTPLVRCYCGECGTPLGADFSMGPIVLLYSKFISGNNMPLYLPNLVLNYASAPAETTRPYDTHTTVRQGLMAPMFLIRVLSRMLLGFLFGKGKGGLLQNTYDSVPVGLEMIPQPKKTK